jgi:hypothetical protein
MAAGRHGPHRKHRFHYCCSLVAGEITCRQSYSLATTVVLSPVYTAVTCQWVSLTHHGAESFLRSSQLCSYSRTSQHFMEPEGSLPCSQQPSTGAYPEPEQSNPCHPILSLYDPFNTVHPPTSWSSQWSLTF